MRLSRTEKPKWEAPKRSEGEIPFCPHTPHPGPQTAFLSLDCREVLFGGAAGGGKSDALLMAALQHVDVPGYAAMLFRRTYADLALPGALMERAEQWLRPTAAKWHDTEKTWSFPSGATLTFGYMEQERHKFRYQSAEFQMIGFDELTQFSETQYRYLFSRLRRLAGMNVPLRVRGATNPGAEWVKDRFAIRSETTEVQVHPSGRVFVPSRLSDNPSLDQEEYVGSLSELDPYHREQLLQGNWDVRPAGEFFERHWFETMPAAPVAARRVRFWDMASTKDGDFTVGCRMAVNNGVYFVEDVVRGRWTPHERDAVIKQTARADGAAVAVALEQEPGSSGLSVVDSMVKMLAGFTVTGRRATGDKVTRAGPFASQAEAGNVHLIQGAWNGVFLDELDSFPAGVHDDQVDAATGAFAYLTEANVNPLEGMLVTMGVRSKWANPGL